MRNVEGSVKRFLERDDDKTVKVINRKRSGQKDEQRDEKIESNSYETDEWHVEFLSDVATLSNEGGIIQTTQAHLYLPGDKDIYFGPEDDDREPSYVEVKGERWKVMRIQDQAAGSLKKIFLKSQESDPSSDRPSFHGNSF